MYLSQFSFDVIPEMILMSYWL